MVWTEPLPKDWVPNIIARRWSWRAPATISEADADPPFIRTTIGLPFVWSLFLALYLLISFVSLPLVETISPLVKNISDTFTAWLKSPPGFDRTSRT